jgi:hypothetical protein
VQLPELREPTDYYFFETEEILHMECTEDDAVEEAGIAWKGKK